MFWFVALTGILPYVFARESMNPSVAAATTAHILAGLGLVCLAGSVTRWIRDRVKYPYRDRGRLLLLFFAYGTGALLTGLAASGRSIGPWRSAYLVHVASGVGCTLLFAPFLRLRLRAGQNRSLLRAAVTATSALLLSAACLAGTTYAAESYFAALTATTPEQARNPLFPAGTRVEGARRWAEAPDAPSCGRPGCHRDIVEDWRASVHAQAAGSRSYRRTLQAASGTLGPSGRKWCVGCHAPTSLAASPPDGDAGVREDPPASIRGVDCLSCHAMSSVPGPIGNGSANYHVPESYPFASASEGAGAWAHGFLLRVRPAPHRASLAGPGESAFPSAMCEPCHQLSLGVAQNRYKHIAFDQTWTDWLASGYSGESAHAFRRLPLRSGCVDCHSRPRGAVHWPGAHGSVDTPPSGVTAPPPVSVEVFALRRQAGAGAPAAVEAPLTRRPATVVPGEVVTVDVLVENGSIGHSFPASLPMTRDVWLEFVVTDEGGRVVAAESGSVDGVGRTAPTGRRNSQAHVFGLAGLDRQGRPVGPDNFYSMVAPVASRFVPAGEGDVARYRLVVPRTARGTLRLTATLRERSLLEDAHTPQTTRMIASDTARVRVGRPGERAAPAPDDVRDAARYFAYGVALLRPAADPAVTAEARAALTRALQLRLRDTDTLVALGRSFLAEGDLLSARARIEEALRIDGRSGNGRAYLGTVLLRMGQNEAALNVLQPLSSEYPRDRLVWLDIGLGRLKTAQYGAAVDAFNRALEVAPDDAGAHYNLMRCYTALNRLTEARREEAIFRALQDDEPLTSLVEPFLQSHPQVRRESRAMHVHLLVAPR